MSDTQSHGGDQLANELAQAPAQASAQSSAERPAQSRPSMRARLLSALRSGIVTLGVLVTVFAAGHAAVDTLHQRAASQDGVAPQPPLPVAVQPLRRQDGYEAATEYAGRVEAARRTDLAFERAGRVTSVFVDEGDRVAAEAPVAALDTDKLEAQRARLLAERRRLEAQLELAQRTQSRQERLNERGFATEQRVDETVTEQAALTASLEAIAAELASLEVDLDDSRLAAPFAGLIASRDVDPGAFVSPGTRVATLLEIQRPQARIGAPPEVAARLDPNATHQLLIDGAAYPATIAAIRPDIDPVTGTVAVLFDIDAPMDGQAPFAVGETARLEVARRVEEPGAWAPLSALQEGRRGLWTVYLAQPDPEAGPDRWRIAQEAVETLHVADGRAYLRTSLPDGALIVSGGVNRIARGQSVRPVQRAPRPGDADHSAAPGDASGAARLEGAQ